MYRVIVVDDEPMMLEGWQTMVDWEAYGFELCGMATDGQEGLELARNLRPELLITDISMPVLDGIGLIKALRQEPNLPMRTIIVSGYSEFDYVRQALQCKVDHYLLKPVLGEEMHELLAELKLALDQSCAEQKRLRQQTEAAAAAAILRLLRAEEATIPEYMARLLGIRPEAQLRMIVGATPDEEDAIQNPSPIDSLHIDEINPTLEYTSEPTSYLADDGLEQNYRRNEDTSSHSSSSRIVRGHRQRSDNTAITLSAHRSAQRLTDGTAALAHVHDEAVDSASSRQHWHADEPWQQETPMVRLAAACRAAGYMAWTFADSPGHTGMLLITEPLSRTAFIAALESCKMAAATSDSELATYRLYSSQPAEQLEELPGLYARAMELRRCSSSARSITVDTDATSDRMQLADYRLDEVQECALHLLQSVQRGDTDAIRATVEHLPERWGRQAVPDPILRVLIRHLLGELLRQAQQREAVGAIDSASWLRHLLGTHADDPAGWSLDTLKRLCLRAAEQVTVNKPARAKGTAASIIAEAKQYMQEHYREKLQLQELAQRFNLNAVYFGQQFKRELGCSFNDYVHRLRIEEAQKLLRRTDMKVAEIAAWLGYHDSDYFTNKYKALTGELPSVYKSRRQG